MNKSSQAKQKRKNNPTMTLKDYYNNLPEATYPKTDFIREVATRCSVAITTVRYWVLEGRIPANPSHLKVLEELTGIPSQSLLKERSQR